ncbi:site-specific integrase [Sulfurimonas sp.]|nr:site-specific integrase [Sulfurimonas sp.]
MGFKTIEKGIYSYYKNSDLKKKHQAYYYSTTGSDGKTKKVKSNHVDIRKVRKERASTDLNIKTDEPTKEHLTLNEVANSYISSKTGKPMPKIEYQKYLKNFQHGLGKKKALKITDTDIAVFKADLEEQGLQPRARLIQLKALLNSVGSTVKFKIPKANTKRKRFFTEDELTIIFDMAQRINPELYMFIKTLLYTGQRPKNVLELSVDDIDFTKNRIDFQEIKGQEAQYIPLAQKLKPLLQEWIQHKHGKVFHYSHDYLAEMAQEIFDKFNRPLYHVDGMTKEEEKEARHVTYKTKRHRWASFYGFRHTTAVNIIKNTGSVYKAQQMLRHSDIQMTQTYAQLVDTDMEDTANAI